MRQILTSLDEYSVLGYSRLGVSLDFPWASELIPGFATYENDSIRNYITFTIWPGNTKSQGAFIYKKELDWLSKKTLVVNGKSYELEIAYDLKFSHFNRYIANLHYYENDPGLKKIVHTKENYYDNSGRWEVNSWSKFERFMNDHFFLDFDWRGKINWDSNFQSTDRSYFTLSVGWEVTAFIPYDDFRKMDQKKEDTNTVAKFALEIIAAFKGLLN